MSLPPIEIKGPPKPNNTPDHLKSVAQVARDEVMFIAKKLDEHFSVGVVIIHAELDEVTIQVTGQSGEEVPDDEIPLMRGFIRGLLVPRDPATAHPTH